MQKVKIKEISNKIFSGGTPPTTESSYWDGNLLWLSSGETCNDYINDTKKKITLEGAKNTKAKTKLAHKNNVVIATAGQGNTRGQVSYLNVDTYINQSIIAIDVNNTKAISKYLFYNLKTRYNEIRLLSDSSSTRGSITKSMIENMEINLPSLAEQQNIANMLSQIDELIQNIDTIHETFFKLLQKMYKKYCFRSTGREPLSSIVEKTGRSCNKKSKEWFNHSVVDLSKMKTDKIFVNTFSKGEEFQTNIRTINNFDFVYGSIRPYFRKAGFVQNVSYVCGTVYSFKAKRNKDYLWILATITSTDFHNYATLNANGTKMPVIKWDDLCEYEIKKIGEKSLDEFNKMVGPIFRYCANLDNNRTKIIEIKNLLLQKYFVL